ncbi:MAG: YoaK family protein [Betaproteobacteria bacterium]
MTGASGAPSGGRVLSHVELGAVLCFVAGAINAGGFLAVGMYTSHMSGVVSSMADNAVLGRWLAVWVGLWCLLAFVGGAMTTALMVRWALRRNLRSAFSRPLVVEAVLLLVFGLFGAAIDARSVALVPYAVVLLCFIMGLQNALITKRSNAEIRTTHITGLVTDLGIELGNLVYINRSFPVAKKVRANRVKIGNHLTLLASFVLGALTGAWGFKTVGFIATLPLALVLVALVARPVWYDFQAWRQRLTVHP